MESFSIAESVGDEELRRKQDRASLSSRFPSSEIHSDSERIERALRPKSKNEAQRNEDAKELETSGPERRLTSLGVETEQRKHLLEAKLLNLLMPPNSRLRRSIWKLALQIEKSQVEAMSRKKETEAIEQTGTESTTTSANHKLAEALYTLIAKELLIPLLEVLLSSRERGNIHAYSKYYAQLLQLESVHTDTDEESSEAVPQSEK